jgi:hypothetical protein
LKIVSRRKIWGSFLGLEVRGISLEAELRRKIREVLENRNFWEVFEFEHVRKFFGN